MWLDLLGSDHHGSCTGTSYAVGPGRLHVLKVIELPACRRRPQSETSPSLGWVQKWSR